MTPPDRPIRTILDIATFIQLHYFKNNQKDYVQKSEHIHSIGLSGAQGTRWVPVTTVLAVSRLKSSIASLKGPVRMSAAGSFVFRRFSCRITHGCGRIRALT